MAGTGTFGVFRLGQAGNEVTLPELSTYNVDHVIQGGGHVLLNGKVIADELGRRKHFTLGWEGLTKEEAQSIDNVFFGTMPMMFMDETDTYPVVRANHSPWEYDKVGFISFTIELEETNA